MTKDSFNELNGMKIVMERHETDREKTQKMCHKWRQK